MIINLKNPKKGEFSYTINNKLKVHRFEKNKDAYGKFHEKTIFDNKVIQIREDQSEKGIEIEVDTAINSYDNFKIDIEV